MVEHAHTHRCTHAGSNFIFLSLFSRVLNIHSHIYYPDFFLCKLETCSYFSEVIPPTSTFEDYWYLKWDIGLKAKRDGGSGSCRESTAPSRVRGAITGSSHEIEWSSSDRAGKAASKGKEDSAEFGGFIFPVLFGSSHVSLLHFPRCHSIPIVAVTLTIHTLKGWEFNCIVIQPHARWVSGFGSQKSQPCIYKR